MTLPSMCLPAGLGAVAGLPANVGPVPNQAIARLSEKGGGRVVVPRGTLVSGTITLLSKATPHLERDAGLKASAEPGRPAPGAGAPSRVTLEEESAGSPAARP